MEFAGKLFAVSFNGKKLFDVEAASVFAAQANVASLGCFSTFGFDGADSSATASNFALPCAVMPLCQAAGSCAAASKLC